MRLKTSRRFRKRFLSYFYVILIPSIIITVFYLRYMYSRVEREYQNITAIKMRNMSSGMEAVLNNVKDMMIQFSLLPSVNRIVSDPHGTEVYDLKLFKEELDSYVTANPLIEAIYVYMRLNGKVISSVGGLYNIQDFFDRDIVNEALHERLNFKKHKIGGNSFYGRLDVLTLSSELPATSSYDLGTLLVHLKSDAVNNILKALSDYSFAGIFIVDSNGEIVLSDRSGSLGTAAEAEHVLASLKNKNDGGEFVTLDKKRYYAAYMKSPSVENWRYVCLLPADRLYSGLKTELYVVFAIFVCVMLVGVVLSYYFSVKMNEAWKQLMLKLGNFLQSKAEDEVNADEYRAVSGAIDALISRNSDITAIVEQNKPILKDRLVLDILWGYADEDVLTRRMNHVEMSFPHKYFFAMAASLTLGDAPIEAITISDIRIYALSVIENAFSKVFRVEGSLIYKDSFGFVFNVAYEEWSYQLKEQITALCSEINAELKVKLNASVCFSFGAVKDNINGVRASFIQARRLLNYQSVTKEGDVLFSIEQESDPMYPSYIQKQIIIGVKTGNTERVVTAVNALFDEYINKSGYSYEKLQQMIFVLIGAVVSERLMEGVNFEQPETNIFSFVLESSNSKMLEDALIEYFKSIMSTEQNENRYIDEVIGFIRANYKNDISLNDISAHVSLHPTYLGRIFKSNTGKTITEYLSSWRIEQAKRLFDDSHLSLREISAMVGFNDIHSFMRYFKKYEGVTPGEFRTLQKNPDRNP